MNEPAEFEPSRPIGAGVLPGFLLLLAAIAAGQLQWTGMAVLLALAVAFLATEVLLRQLPGSLMERIQRNCIRVDGSWSQRRETIEKQSLQKLRWKLLVVISLFFASGLAILWVVTGDVSGISLGPPEPAPGTSLEEEQRNLESWQSLLVIGLVSWLVVSWLIIASLFRRWLKQLMAKIETRYKHYLQLDLELK